jgi:hypothetical protein
MKKLLTIIMAFLLFLPLTGFTDVHSTARQVVGGKVQEVVELKYSNEDLAALNTTPQLMNEYLSTFVTPTVKTNLINIITENTYSLFDDALAVLKKIGVSVDNTISSDGGKITVNIVYQTAEIWNVFCEDIIQNTENITQTSFFLKTYKTVMPVKLSSLTVGGQTQSVQSVVYEQVQNLIIQQFPLAQSLFTSQFNYTYATSNTRLHSNADNISIDTYGYTTHTWHFEDNLNNQIELWQVRANAVTWYLLALGTTLVFGISLWLIAKRKPKAIEPY